MHSSGPRTLLKSLIVRMDKVTNQKQMLPMSLLFDTSSRSTKTTACLVEETKMGNISNSISIIKRLGKMRLTWFVTASSIVGGIMADVPFESLGVLGIGVTALSLSANTMNQCLEIHEDSMMCRTKKRPLVTGEISLRNAVGVAAIEFTFGCVVLYHYSLSCSLLGALNWVLYVFCYTPAKKLTVYNTEIGAFVGAIPPIMGGLYLECSASLTGTLWLGLIIYLWQMPHFYALSFLCRKDYERAGYQMIASSSVKRTCRKSVLYTVALAISVIASPSLLGFHYPRSYFFVSTILLQIALLKTILFYYNPSRYCRESFVFSYVWLGLQLLLIIFGHFHHLRSEKLKKDTKYISNNRSAFTESQIE